MGRGLLNSLENTSGLDNVVSADRAPRNCGGVLLTKDLDVLAINDKGTIIWRDLTLVTAMGRIIGEHVGSVFGANKRVIHRNNFDIGVLESVTQDKTADTTESVNTNLDSHCG